MRSGRGVRIGHMWKSSRAAAECACRDSLRSQTRVAGWGNGGVNAGPSAPEENGDARERQLASTIGLKPMVWRQSASTGVNGCCYIDADRLCHLADGYRLARPPDAQPRCLTHPPDEPRLTQCARPFRRCMSSRRLRRRLAASNSRFGAARIDRRCLRIGNRGRDGAVSLDSRPQHSWAIWRKAARNTFRIFTPWASPETASKALKSYDPRFSKYPTQKG